MHSAICLPRDCVSSTSPIPTSADWTGEKAKIDAVRRACAGLDYDLLVHTGDFLHDDGGLGNVLDLLDALPRRGWALSPSSATTTTRLTAPINS